MSTGGSNSVNINHGTRRTPAILTEICEETVQTITRRQADVEAIELEVEAHPWGDPTQSQVRIRVVVWNEVNLRLHHACDGSRTPSLCNESLKSLVRTDCVIQHNRNRRGRSLVAQTRVENEGPFVRITFIGTLVLWPGGTNQHYVCVV